MGHMSWGGPGYVFVSDIFCNMDSPNKFSGMHSDLSSKTGNDAISMGNFILQHRITKVRGYIYE